MNAEFIPHSEIQYNADVNAANTLAGFAIWINLPHEGDGLRDRLKLLRQLGVLFHVEGTLGKVVAVGLHLLGPCGPEGGGGGEVGFVHWTTPLMSLSRIRMSFSPS